MSTSALVPATLASAEDRAAILHLHPFHSCVCLFASSRSLVFRARRPPVSSLSSASSSDELGRAADVGGPYSSTTKDTWFALKLLVHSNADGRLRPVRRSSLARFTRQFDLLRLMADRQVRGVVRAFELLAVRLTHLPSATSISTVCLVTEFFPGLPLASFVAQPSYSHGIPLAEWFSVARSLLSTVSAVHACHIVHKDLSHHNVLYDRLTEVCCVVDFELSDTSHTTDSGQSRTADGDDEPDSDMAGGEQYVRGTLPFISPEQTGRVNRVVDARSDLYSVGVLLYETATGRLPFASQSRDELELLHAIITQVPATPVSLRPALPPMLSAIIMHLLEKDASQRYQSANSAMQDVLQVHDQFMSQLALHVSPSSMSASDQAEKAMSVAPVEAPEQASGGAASSSASLSTAAQTSGAASSPAPPPPPASCSDDDLQLSSMLFPSFPLARGDMSSRFHIPTSLYGRQAQLDAVRHSFDSVDSKGGAVIVCVDGLSGSGKASPTTRHPSSSPACHQHVINHTAAAGDNTTAPRSSPLLCCVLSVLV